MPLSPATPLGHLDEQLRQVRLRAYGRIPKIPQLLFHYTDLRGGRGILESSEVWATEARFTNDPKELRSAWPHFKVALEHADLLSDAFRSRLIASLEKEEERPTVSTYISSFSEAGDLLSQWRAYAGDGDGVALGFDIRACEPVLDEGLVGPALMKVVYDDGRLRRIARQIVEKSAALLNRFLFDHSSQTQRAERLMTGSMHVGRALYSSAFKQKAFQEEAEWRMLSLSKKEPSEAQHLSFRESRFGLAPYIGLPLRRKPVGKRQGTFVLKRIVVGPRSNFDLAERSLRLLLAKVGVPNVDIRRAGFEYR